MCKILKSTNQQVLNYLDWRGCTIFFNLFTENIPYIAIFKIFTFSYKSHSTHLINFVLLLPVLTDDDSSLELSIFNEFYKWQS